MQPTPPPKKNKHNTLVASIGAGLEYYDFVIYALLSSYLSRHFFAAASPAASLLETFGVFAVGYLLRPVGGILFGHWGDRYGRKLALMIAMLGMALSTFLIGMLPTYQSIGIAAPLLLIILRMLQGISFGAELPGAITFIIEHAKRKRRGLQSGLMIACVSLGAMLGSLLVYALNKGFSQETMWEYGWRLPFLLGGLLAVAGYWMRKKAQETPQYALLTASEKPAIPAQTLIQSYPSNLLKACGMLIFPASFIIFGLFIPGYAHGFLHLAMSEIFLVMTIGLLWSALLLPIFGWVSDYVGRRNLLIIAVAIFLVAGYFLFSLLNVSEFRSLLTFMLLYETLVSALAASYFPLLAELFPTPVRYSGVAICYNIVYSIAGCVPMLLSFILKFTAAPSQMVWFFISLALLSLLSAFKIKAEDIPG